MPIDQKIALGMVTTGSFTSPAEAAMAEKPKKVMKTIAEVLAMATKSELKRETRVSTSTAGSPPATNHISRMTLPRVTTIWKVPLSLVPLVFSSVSRTRATMPEPWCQGLCQTNSCQ